MKSIITYAWGSYQGELTFTAKIGKQAITMPYIQVQGKYLRPYNLLDKQENVVYHEDRQDVYNQKIDIIDEYDDNGQNLRYLPKENTDHL